MGDIHARPLLCHTSRLALAWLRASRLLDYTASAQVTLGRESRLEGHVVHRVHLSELDQLALVAERARRRHERCAGDARALRVHRGEIAEIIVTLRVNV